MFRQNFFIFQLILNLSLISRPLLSQTQPNSVRKKVKWICTNNNSNSKISDNSTEYLLEFDSTNSNSWSISWKQFIKGSTGESFLRLILNEQNSARLNLCFRIFNKKDLKIIECGNSNRKLKTQIKLGKEKTIHWRISKDEFSNCVSISLNNQRIFYSYKIKPIFSTLRLIQDEAQIFSSPDSAEIELPQIKKVPSNCQQIRKIIPGLETFSEAKNPVWSPDEKSFYFSATLSGKNDIKSNNEDIYIYKNGDEKSQVQIIHSGSPLNNQGPNFVVSISQDENKLIVGNTYQKNGSPESDGLSCSEKSIEGWTLPYSIQIQNFKNNNETQSFHMSADESRLFMAIENKKSKGAKDLFLSFKIKEDLYSEPIWLGDSINSEADEFNPVLAKDNQTLFFASYGHQTYGNADLFMSRRLDETWMNWSVPVNLGSCINTKEWDGGIAIKSDGKSLLVVSENEENRKITLFETTLPDSLMIQPSAWVQIICLDQNSKEKIKSNVFIKSKRNNFTTKEIVSEGETQVYLPYRDSMEIFAETKNFLSFPTEIILQSEKNQSENYLTLELQKIVAGQEIKIPFLEFKLNSFKLNSEAKKSLVHFANYLRKNAERKIHIIGNTDSTGNDLLNQELAMKRAEVVYLFLRQNGIEAKRIKYSANLNGEGYSQRKREVTIKIEG